MYAIGGIIGDMVGEPYEFIRNMKTKDFLFLDKEYNIFTDDSVMTLAVAEGILNAGITAEIIEIKECIKKSMLYWGQKYPDAGYGGSFSNWLFSPDPHPYNSWGNGSAMRMGLIPWLYMDNLEKCLEVAAAQAELTHNHPEGIKGAVCIAHVTWLALHGVNKEDIRKMVCDKYYPLKESCDSIRKWYRFDVSCQGTCPVSIQCFLESTDFEDAIRLSISMGGDADTLGCITGTIAEAYYHQVPIRYQKIALEILPDDLKQILFKANKMIEEKMIHIQPASYFAYNSNEQKEDEQSYEPFRDPSRIETFIEQFENHLKTYWHHCPDYRFGQIISNFSSYAKRYGFSDLYFIEDEEFIAMWKRYIMENQAFHLE